MACHIAFYNRISVALSQALVLEPGTLPASFLTDSESKPERIATYWDKIPLGNSDMKKNKI